MGANILPKLAQEPTKLQTDLAKEIIPDMPGMDFVVQATRRELAAGLPLNTAAIIFLGHLSSEQHAFVIKQLADTHRHMCSFDAFASVATQAVHDELMRLVNEGIPADL